MSRLGTASREEALRAQSELGMLDVLRQAPGWDFRRDVDEAGEVASGRSARPSSNCSPCPNRGTGSRQAGHAVPPTFRSP